MVHGSASFCLSANRSCQGPGRAAVTNVTGEVAEFPGGLAGSGGLGDVTRGTAAGCFRRQRRGATSTPTRDGPMSETSAADGARTGRSPGASRRYPLGALLAALLRIIAVEALARIV